MAMKNPPRRTTIRGQKHLLAYITPEEADILKAMGGSGEKVHGIPAFYGGFDDDRTQAGESSDFSGAEGGYDRGGGADDNDGQPTGMSPGAMGGAIGSSYQTAPSVGDGFDVNLNKAMSQIAAAPANQRLGFTDRQIMKAYQTGTQPGIMGMLGMPLGRTQNYLTFNDPRKGIYSSFDSQAAPLGLLGFASELFDLDPYVTTGFNQDGTLGDGMDRDGGRDDVVPTQTNSVTGQEECPDGYMFDEDLQACRLDTSMSAAPSLGGRKTFGRIGLLDVAPLGMSMFADRYNIPQQNFDAANLAFRRSGGLLKRQPGYTRLS